MKLRTLVIAIVILAALSGVVALVNRPPARPPEDARVAQPIAAASLVEKATGIRISESGRTVELKKSPAGAWQVTSYFDFPADLDKLSRFAGDLTDLKISRLVTTTPATLARLGFKDSRIELLDANGQPLLDLVLGKSPDTGTGRFVRYGTEDKAYLTGLDSALDTEPKNWAAATLLKLKPDEVAKVEVTFPETETASAATTVTAIRAAKDKPYVSPADSARSTPLNSSAITTLVESLTAMRFTDTTATDDANATAAKSATRLVKLTTFDQKTITLAMGRKPEEKKPKPAAPIAPDAKPADSTTPPAPTDAAAKPADPAKPTEPEFDVIPAGPVYAFVTHSDTDAPINGLMTKRAFQVAEYTFTSLPQKADDLFESPPASPVSGSAPPISVTTPPLTIPLPGP